MTIIIIVISVPLRGVQTGSELRAEDHGRHVVRDGRLPATLSHHVAQLYKGGNDDDDDDDNDDDYDDDDDDDDTDNDDDYDDDNNDNDDDGAEDQNWHVVGTVDCQ